MLCCYCCCYLGFFLLVCFLFLSFGFFLCLLCSLRAPRPAARGPRGHAWRGSGAGPGSVSGRQLHPSPDRNASGKGDSWKRNFHLKATREKLFETKSSRGRVLVHPKPPPRFPRMRAFKPELFLFKDGYTPRQTDGRFLIAEAERLFPAAQI